MQFQFNGRGRGIFSSIPPVTLNIIIINTLVWLVTYLKPDFMYATFSLFYPASQYFRWWQPVTHIFMHGGFWHLFFNMYTFFFFGSVLERVWGPKKFLLFYFVTGLGAAALHTGVEWAQACWWGSRLASEDVAVATSAAASLRQLYLTPTVGASGAIYGLLLAYAMLFPESRMTLLFPPVTLKAKWFVIIFAVIELITGVTGMGGGVAHFAHLGGMLFGLILVLWWKKGNKMYTYYDN